MLQTLDQRRAKHAWHALDRRPANLGSEADGLPATVLQTGLAQTSAFYAAKGDPHRTLLARLAHWLLDNEPASTAPVVIYPTGADDAALVERLIRDLIDGDSAHYRRRTTEALAYLVWLKRFAKARATS